MKLFVVEGPGKRATIKKYLGDDFEVFATKGHVRDLPAKTLAVDIEHNFEPKYAIMPDKKEIVASLKSKAAKAEKIYLATDPDREGEAISWHLENILGIDENEKCRITFNSISKDAIWKAMESPRAIDKNLVDAQQARRVLDRLVGYKLSPYLSRKISTKSLSAGRVQSVTLKLITDREKEIENFKPEEFWNFASVLEKDNVKFKASLIKKNGKKVKLSNKEQVDETIRDLTGANYTVSSMKKTVAKSHAPAPFTTITMQQEAQSKIGLSLSRTTKAAQALYEGVELAGEGKTALITYIRTDSVRVSEDAMKMAKAHIIEKYGDKYYPEKPNYYKSKTSAQDAHEAIRPINLAYTPEKVKDSLQSDLYKLYKLVYERFVASQMAEAAYNSVVCEVDARDYTFKAAGKTLIFPGFLSSYGYQEEKTDEEKEEDASKLPPMNEGDNLNFVEFKTEQKFTKPPARYNEGTLVKAMDENGIGRPSTTATTVAILFAREYVKLDKKQIVPTELGKVVVDVLTKNFADIMNIEFTAEMENKLDSIEEGKQNWQKLVGSFYDNFEDELVKAGENKDKIRLSETLTDEVCEKCGAKMAIRVGKFGKFLGCSNYPKCNFIKPLVKKVGVCPECGCDVVERQSKKGTVYYSCTGYPNCKFMSWDIPLSEKCPNCGSYLVKKITREGDKISCSNSKCNYTRVDKKGEEDVGN